MSIVIGLDGGGSKTSMVAVDRNGAVVGHWQAAGCNPFDHREWRNALVELRDRSATLRAEAAAIALGMPGYGEVIEVSRQQEDEAKLFGVHATLVMNDVKAAFEGAFCGKPGVLLLAGTGSMIWGRSDAGNDIRVGGWGYEFGDEGSAFWIGREAVARASRAIDGRSDALSFAKALFANLELSFDDPHGALIGWYSTRRYLRAEVAALARFVDQIATIEPEAAVILGEAADHLAAHVLAGWKAVNGIGHPIWSIAGGTLQSTYLRSQIVRRVGSPFVEPMLPPVGGAVYSAAIDAGWLIDAQWIENLRSSLVGYSQKP